MKTRRAISDFLEAKHGYSPRTIEQYGRALDYLLKVCPDLPGDVRVLRRALNEVQSVWVRHAYWIVWRVFYHWCAEEFKVKNVMARVEEPSLPDVELRGLDIEDLSLVLAAADLMRDKCIVVLAADSGVRASEFGRIRVSDVGKETIRLIGKGRKQIRVPISDVTRSLLESFITESRLGPGGYLFRRPDGKPMSRFGVYRIVRRCMDKAGILGGKRGPHCLRHSLGKNYIADGGDSITLKRIMRHEDIETTLKYVNLDLGEVISQHRQHSPLRLIPAKSLEPTADSRAYKNLSVSGSA